MSPLRSGAATLRTSLVICYDIGGDSFNHNTVLLPFQAATLLLFRLATQRGGGWLWFSMGLFAGLSVLVKQVALAPLAGMALYFAFDRSLHHQCDAAGRVAGLPHFRAGAVAAWAVADIG